MSYHWRDGNRLQLLENGEEFFPRVFEVIAQAKKEVLLETFILFQDKVGNDVLYGKLPKLSDKIWSRRLKLAEHCLRHPELLVLANYQVTGKPKAEQRFCL